MTESGDLPGNGRGVARVAGLAVLVVVAVVLARARAQGLTPPRPGLPHGSVVEHLIQTMAGTVLVAGIVLLLGGSRLRKVRAKAKRKKKKKAGEAGSPLNRRLVAAVMAGLFLSLVFQLLNNRDDDKSQYSPPPKPPGDEVLVAPEGVGQPPPGSVQHKRGIPDGLLLAGALLSLGALVFAVTRKDTLVEEDDEDEQDEAVVATAVRAARAAVLDRTITDPREAIVACFAAMEAALADRGGGVTPEDADTPEEVLRRGIDKASLPAEAALTLLRLFREARFSTHPITEPDRAEADSALLTLLHSLGVPTGELAGGAG